MEKTLAQNPLSTPKTDTPAQLPVHLSIDGGILRLMLDQPQRRNALSMAMMTAISDALSQAAADERVRVVVIAANGPAFCAGHDLKELTVARRSPDGGRQFFADTMAHCSVLMQQIVNLPKPVIAEVAATATAAGCQLVASCDLAYAADTVKFATPGVNIGLFCSTPMVALSRNVSRKHAMEMLLRGDMITADRAERIGLINAAVPPDALFSTVQEAASLIASKSMMTVRTGKHAFYTQAELPLAEAYAYASRVMVENMMKRDAEEGIGAFVEKRRPEWTDE